MKTPDFSILTLEAAQANMLAATQLQVATLKSERADGRIR